MKFVGIEIQQNRIRDSIEEHIKRVLKHGRYINGPEVKELEEQLSSYVNVQYALGVSSGTDALLMSLMAFDIDPGDGIFTTSFSFIASVEMVHLLKATPILIDIDPHTFNIDTQKLEQTIKRTIKENKIRPRGIISVDLFGQTADYDEINRIAKKYHLFVIEDAAQSFGASYKGEKACSLADVATTSFYPTKPLGCYGDGGMIFTNNKALYKKLISIREHGQGKDQYDNVRIGINGRLDTIQASILLTKLKLLDEEMNMRQRVAERYNKLLKDLVEVPYVRDCNRPAWALYSVMHPKRDEIINILKSKGIPTMIYYPKPLHLQRVFQNSGYREGDFSVSEEIAKRIFSLPMHPYLQEKEQEEICRSLNDLN
ncbi:MAG: DegT/DnrJ/EryC1/StrS family aminotransferase [Spirochaetota bacterium]|nr:DegT/DnrJ/EryC1/StrS family aminotransferase [Spirochaetota bacterium]